MRRSLRFSVLAVSLLSTRGVLAQQPPAPPPAAPAADSALGDDGHPLAGWHNGLFYLRDAHDNFVLFPQGRAQVDTYSYFGPGVGDTTLKPTMFLRRVRPEVTGEIAHKWSFMIAGDFAPTALDNPKAANETSVASATSGNPATTTRYASPQTSSVKATATDVFLVYKAHDLLNIQGGQYDLPFSMENRTSDKYFEFIERPLAVRAVGVPLNKDMGVMAWGWGDKRLFYYSLGVFNGAGQSRLSTDGRPELAGRAFARPLVASRQDALKNLQVGASVRAGSHDQKYTFYDYPQLTTQGNWAFWVPTYNGAGGLTHVIPAGDQLSIAGELRVPIEKFDLQGEFVYIRNETREAIDGFQATNTERLGTIKGSSYYVQVGYWPLGNRDINGMPGDENLPKIDWSKPDTNPPARALQLLAKWEQVILSYSSASRGGKADSKGIDGDIHVNALSLGANYWATKHVRLSVNYIANMFPDSEPLSQTKSTGGPTSNSSQRALAPGNTLGQGVNDDARDNAHVLHELIFRFAVAL